MAVFKYNATLNKLVPLTSEGTSLGLPVGAVQGFALGTQSPNWLLCDGRDTTGTAEELATHYPALYTYLGNSNVLPTQFDHSKLSDFETITLPTSAANAITMQYDGELFYVAGAPQGAHLYIYINGVSFNIGEAPGGGGGNDISSFIPLKKGDVIYVSKSTNNAKVAYYKQPLYIKATSAGIEVDTDLYATKGMVKDTVSYSTEEKLTGGTWIDGKRIYRKCGVYNNTTGNDIVLDSTLTTSYIDTVVSMDCCGICGNPEVKTTIRGFTGDGYRLDLLVTNTGFHKLKGNISYTTLTWWIEYTKTTD